MTEVWSLRPPAKDGELLMEGGILQGQPRAVPKESAGEQEDSAEDGHLRLPLGKLADRSG